MHNFSLLIIDSDQRTSATDPESLLYLLRGASALWDEKPVVKQQIPRIEFKNVQISVRDSMIKEAEGYSFYVEAVGPLDELEPLREKVMKFLTSQGYSLLYIIKDDVSRDLAVKLYPLLFEIENQLRSFVIEFFTRNVGADWWGRTAPSTLKEKAKRIGGQRKGITSRLPPDVYMIDFGELGELVYEYSSDIVTKEDLLAKIYNLQESKEAVVNLKKEIQSNYNKFFKESFADQGFKEAWKSFKEIRDRIAHSQIFSASDVAKGEELGAQVRRIILDASEGTAEVEISEEQSEALEEEAANRGYEPKTIDQNVFFAALDAELDKADRQSGYVGLSTLMRKLSWMGYSHATVKNLISSLEEQGDLEFYSVTTEKGHSAKALRYPTS